MASYIFDLESDGFLEECTKIHCLVLKDIDNGKVYSYGPTEIAEGLDRLHEAELIVGHNCIKFDLPVIDKLHCFIFPQDKVQDTLVMARLIFSNIKEEDYARQTPKEAVGSHSLKAWGIRLGEKKQDYQGGFSKWSREMQDYCEQDVEVGWKLYWNLANRNYSEKALALEHKVAWLCAAMERNGFPFDMERATELYASLSHKREALKRDLQNIFPPWEEVDKVFIPKADNKRYGYRKGVPVTKMKTLTFNPASGLHIHKCLERKYGWKPRPDQMLASGRAKMDVETLSSLHFPEAKRLAEFFKLNKLIGMLAEGDQAWLKKVGADSRIHAAYNTNGAVTGRATHAYPNIAQVPKVRKDRDKQILKGLEGAYGFECRSLFGVQSIHNQDWRQLGSDMSGLELRCLAHFMAYYDEGEYVKAVTEGDVHAVNMQATGLDRDTTKTFVYALLYGAQNPRIADILGSTVYKAKKLREAFFEKTPALAALKGKVDLAVPRGFLKGLDGREVYIRSAHSALNTLLQSAGALLCKTWITLVEERLQELGFKHGWDGEYVFLAWIHDEIQLAVRPSQAELIGDIIVEMAAEAGRVYNFKCPLTAEYHTGLNWAETH